MLRRAFDCIKLWIVLEDKLTVLIPSLSKLFLVMLVEEVFGKVMCVWGRLILSEVVETLLRVLFLYWIYIYIYILTLVLLGLVKWKRLNWKPKESCSENMWDYFHIISSIPTRRRLCCSSYASFHDENKSPEWLIYSVPA